MALATAVSRATRRFWLPWLSPVTVARRSSLSSLLSLALLSLALLELPSVLASAEQAEKLTSWSEETTDYTLRDKHSNDVVHSLIGPDGAFDGSKSPVTLKFRAHNITVHRQFFAVASPVHGAQVSIWDGAQWREEAIASHIIYQTRNRDSVLVAEGRVLSALIRSKHVLYDLKFPALTPEGQGAAITGLEVSARQASGVLPKTLTGRVPPIQREAQPRVRSARRLGFAPDELDQWTDCYAGQETAKQLEMGIVVAPKLYLKWGSLTEAQSFVASIVAKARTHCRQTQQGCEIAATTHRSGTSPC